mgnify:CR=1 FL=1|jgi:hypothetical protein
MSEMTVVTLLEEAKIEKVLNRYATALDSRNWSELAEVFAPDATANYQGIGLCNGLGEIVELVKSVLGQCGPTQHLLGNVDVQVNGSEAQARCYLQAIHVGIGDYEGQILTVWGEYRDELRRTPAGWRIVYRELAGIHTEGDIGLGQE